MSGIPLAADVTTVVGLFSSVPVRDILGAGRGDCFTGLFRWTGACDVVASHAIARISGEKRCQFGLRGGHGPIAKRGIDELPLAAQLDVRDISLIGGAPQFVNFKGFGETLRTDAIDAAKAKPCTGALLDTELTSIDVP
jgi:hypothetical protein